MPVLLSLTLFVLLIRADHPHHAAAADDLALVTDSLHRRSDLHVCSSNLSALSICTIRRVRDPTGDSSHAHPIADQRPGRVPRSARVRDVRRTQLHPHHRRPARGTSRARPTATCARRSVRRRPLAPMTAARQPLRRPVRLASVPRDRHFSRRQNPRLPAPSPPRCARNAPTGCRPASPPSTRRRAPSPPPCPAFTIGSIASTIPSASRGPRPGSP